MTQGGVQMSPRIKPEPSATPLSRERLFRLRPRVWACLVILAGLGFGAHLLWRSTAPIVSRGPEYALTAEDIHITAPPAWIRSDIKSQALRDSGLTGTISLLDNWDILSHRVKEAFSLHPWVASVNRVARQLPASLDVDLTYRRPIAAVESSDPTGVMFLPIDENAVRLPEADLTEVERRYLPRISGITGRPQVGDGWNDPRVLGGARLAAQLFDVWQKLRLVEILANMPTTPRDEKLPCTFEIVTIGGTHIIWGTMPGQEPPGAESSFNEKRQRLLDYASQHGKLESIDGPAVLDVRSNLVITPRTAKNVPAASEADAIQTK